MMTLRTVVIRHIELNLHALKMAPSVLVLEHENELSAQAKKRK